MLLLLLLISAPGADTTLQVMSFNIRYDTPQDGEHNWKFRREEVAETVRMADIAGIQEALHGQMQELADLLPEYEFVGVGRDDGERAGEYSAIFYSRSRFAVLASGTFWLSEEPDVPGSRSWDAAITRIATWSRFEDLASRDTFFVFNTHFDHRGSEARKRSAALLLSRVEEMAGAVPAIVVGDFNAEPDSEVYRTLAGTRLVDARAATRTPPEGPAGTFTGFTDEPRRRLDYIFVDRAVRVEDFSTIARFAASDHLAVLARISGPGRLHGYAPMIR